MVISNEQPPVDDRIQEIVAKFSRKKEETCLLIQSKNRFLWLVGVRGFEPRASWSRILLRKFKERFRVHLVLFVTGAVALQTSLLQYFRPLPAWSGSAFGSEVGCTGRKAFQTYHFATRQENR